QILGEKSSAQASVEKLKKKVAGWEALRPRDFEGQKIRRSRVSEASQKQDSTNEEELMSNLVGGLERGDVTDTQAVMYQAAKVQHLNEIVERTRATEDYYEHAEKGLIGEKEYKKMTPAERAEHLLFNGEAVFKKGGGLSASAMGLHAFINETLIKTLKVDPQTAYTIENDLSNIAEQVDQWTMGQANGTKGDGTMYQRTYLDQQARVRTERSKVDAEKLNRGGNRLSTSTEKWVDPFDFSKGRYTDLNPYRVDELKSNPEQILSFLKRGRYNVSEAQHVVRFNMDVINKVVVPAMRNKGMKEADIKEFLAKMGEIGGATKKGVTRDTADTVRESHELIEQQRKEREKSGKPAIKGQHRGMPGI
ncbi:hypothetical protein KKG41_00925, partial [Patescibacteria group bacterium]|nr:hypothetical protein [Patescibacteria group bacterium]MBU1890089.1 hypothetical protein [Patescibacteria group bacterium]